MKEQIKKPARLEGGGSDAQREEQNNPEKSQ